jgi:hypothetical protein
LCIAPKRPLPPGPKKAETPMLRRCERRRETKNTSLVGVAKSSVCRVHNILNRNVPPQAISRNHRAQLSKVSVISTGPQQLERVATYVEHGRTSGDRRGSVHLYTNGTSCERVPVARVPALPFVPDLVDHLTTDTSASPPSMKPLKNPYRVVKEKHRVYVKGGNRFQISARTQPKPKPFLPFGDHFIPLVH